MANDPGIDHCCDRPCALKDAGDKDLLRAFSSRRDEAAFAMLVHRHGPMVFSVCRRILRDEQAAEDAFQATFLVLARKAGAISWQRTIGNWLYAVAVRTATKERCRGVKRRAREKPLVDDLTMDTSKSEASWQEIRPLLDEELSRLPRKYRAPVVLCYFEGKTYAEAAKLLGWKAGTVSGRLARAREMLRRRLTRRGIGITGITIAGVLSQNCAPAAVPAALVDSSVKGAVLVAGSKALAVAGVAPKVASLAQHVMKDIAAVRAKVTLCVLLGLVGAGFFFVWAFPKTFGGIAFATFANGRQATAKIEQAIPVFSVRERAKLGQWRDGVLALSFTPDAKTLAAVIANAGVHIWETDDGALLRTIDDGGIAAPLAISKDGKLLATASRDGAIHLRNLATGAEWASLSQGPAGVTALSFSPIDMTLASGDVNGFVTLWDAAARREQRSVSVYPRESVYCLAFAPDSLRLASAPLARAKPKDAAGVKLWQAPSRHERDFPHWQARRLAFSPDGKMLAGGGEGGTVQLCDVQSGNEMESLPDASAPWRTFAETVCVSFSPEGSKIAAVLAATDKTQAGAEPRAILKIWSLNERRELAALPLLAGKTPVAAFAPDWRMLAVSARSRISGQALDTLVLFDLQVTERKGCH